MKTYTPSHLFPFSPVRVAVLLLIFLVACTAAPNPTIASIPISSPSPLPLFTSTPSFIPQPSNTLTPTHAPTYTPRPTRTPEPTLIPEIFPVSESLSWSPDSRWLAYTLTDGTVWLMDIGAFDPIPVPDIQAGYPASLKTTWSSDGGYLLVYGVWGFGYPQWTAMWLVAITGEGAGDAQVLVKPVQPIPPVYQNEGVIYSASWSPDGRRIAYSYGGDAWVYDLDTGLHSGWTTLVDFPLSQLNRAEPFDGVRQVAFSPDGTHLALDFTCNCPSPWSGVGVMELIEDNQVGAILLVDGARLIGWSPDGLWITAQNITGDFSTDYTYDIYGVAPATGELVNLTRSNPNFDPLLDGYEHFQPGGFATYGLQWGSEGQYLYQITHWETDNTLPFSGFVVRSDPETILEEHTSSETGHPFPFLDPNGRVAYVETESDSSSSSSHLRRVIVDGDVKFEFPQDQNWMATVGVWSPNGLHLALIRNLRLNSAESEVVILRDLGN